MESGEIHVEQQLQVQENLTTDMHTEELENVQDMKIFNNAMLYGPSDSDFAQDLRSSFKSDLFNSNR